MHQFHLHKIQNQTKLMYDVRHQERNSPWHGRIWAVWGVGMWLLGSWWWSISWSHLLVTAVRVTKCAILGEIFIKLYHCDLYTSFFVWYISCLLLPPKNTSKPRGSKYLSSHRFHSSGRGHGVTEGLWSNTSRPAWGGSASNSLMWSWAGFSSLWAAGLTVSAACPLLARGHPQFWPHGPLWHSSLRHQSS